jgi:hypothetical protein
MGFVTSQLSLGWLFMLFRVRLHFTTCFNGFNIFVTSNLVKERGFDFFYSVLQSALDGLSLFKFLRVINRHCLLLKLFCCFQVFLTTELAFKHFVNDLSFIFARFSKCSAQTHKRDRAIRVSYRCQLSLDSDACKHGITDLLRVGNLILAVEEVPYIKEAVHSCEEKDTWAGGRPAAISQVSLVVASLHNWVEDSLLAPHLGLPVTNTHEVLDQERIPLKRVNRSVVLALSRAESELSFNLLSL